MIINLLSSISNIWYPERFHKFHKNQEFFEGCYFKIEDELGENVFAIIVGYSNTKNVIEPFIQVVNGKENSAKYYRFQKHKLQVNPNQVEITLGTNYFTEERIVLDLPELKGQLDFHGLEKWNKTIIAPNIMGPLSYWPHLECNHGLISLNHSISGKLKVNQQAIDFTKGIGYSEKDWGTNFPKAHIWLQCNRFNIDGVSLSIAIAKMIVLGKSMVGFAAILSMKKKQHVFASYRFSELKVSKIDSKIFLEFKGFKYTLKVSSAIKQGAKLVSPNKNGMKGEVYESLNSNIYIQLKNNWNNQQNFEARGINAGVEISGEW